MADIKDTVVGGAATLFSLFGSRFAGVVVGFLAAHAAAAGFALDAPTQTALGTLIYGVTHTTIDHYTKPKPAAGQ